MSAMAIGSDAMINRLSVVMLQRSLDRSEVVMAIQQLSVDWEPKRHRKRR